MALKGLGILEGWMKNNQGEEMENNQYKWIKSLPYAMAVCDKAGKILSMNQGFVDLTGHMREELEMQRMYWFLPKDQGKKIQEELKEVQQGERIIREIYIEDFGKQKLMEVTVIPFEEQDGFEGQFWIFNDQSEKQEMETELKRLKQGFHNSKAGFKVGTWTYDFEKEEFYASSDTYQIFGRTPGEFDGSLGNVLEFLHREDRRGFQEAMEKAHKGTPLDLVFRIITNKGEQKDIHARAEMFYRKDQSPDKMIGTVQDLTNHRYMERSLGRLQNNLPKEEAFIERNSYRVDLTEDTVEFGMNLPEIYNLDPTVRKQSREAVIKSIHPEDRYKIQEVVENLKSGESYEILYRIIGKENDEYLLVRSKGTGEFHNGKLVALVGTIEDLTNTKLLEEDIQKTYRELQEVQRAFRMGIWSMDLRTYELSWSKVTFEIYGWDPEAGEPGFEDFLQMVHPQDRSKVDQAINHPPKEQPFNVEFRILPPTGEVRHIKHLVEILYQGETPIVIRGNIQDVTDQRELEKKAEKTQQAFEKLQNRYQLLLDNAEEILEIIDENGVVKYINPGVIKMMGFESQEIVGKYIWDFVDGVEKEKLKNLVEMCRNNPKKILRGTVKTRTKDQQEKYLEVTMNNHMNDPKIQGIILNWKDTTAKVNLQNTVHHMANFDEVSGLPNRNYFVRRTEEEVQRARNKEEEFALFMIDVDEFKTINNALGADVGDQLIKKVGQLLQHRFPEDRGFLARYYGDQFALILRGVEGPKEGQRVAEEILDLFRHSVSVDQYELNVSVSVGFSTYPEDGRKVGTLIKCGNTALTRAKEEGKNRSMAYSSKLDMINFKKFNLRNDLARAIEEEQLRLHFQPIINLHNGKILVLEALIRWEHPEWGLVPPNEFIPIAESTGFIVPMGQWVLDQVCNQYRKWIDKGYPEIKISINSSGIEFFQRNFVRDIESTLQKHKLRADFLIIEITESVLIEQRQQTEKDIADLQSMGVQVAIDDFGSGYSSLTYLNKMNVDILKIDQEFLKTVPEKATSNKILEAVVNLAKELKMKIVAEGIENWEQLIFLRRLNCISGQGYLYSKPLTVEKVEPILARGWLRPLKANNARNQVKNDRRKYFRVGFPQDLMANMTILEINGKKVTVGHTKSLIKNIGPGGLCFVANINLPLKKDLILQFSSELLGTPLRVYGTPVWKEGLEQGFVKYGLKFTFDENARMELTGLLNKVQIRIRKDYGFNEGSFTSKSMKAFFHHRSRDNSPDEI